MPYAHCGLYVKIEKALFSASSVQAARPPRLFSGYLLPSYTMHPFAFQQGNPVISYQEESIRYSHLRSLIHILTPSQMLSPPSPSFPLFLPLSLPPSSLSSLYVCLYYGIVRELSRIKCSDLNLV